MSMPNPQLDLTQNLAGQNSLTPGPGGGFYDSNGIWWPGAPGSGANPNISTDANGVSTIGGQTYTQTSPGVYVGNVTGVPGTPGTPAQPLTSAQQDAFSRLNQILNQYGLGSLATWIRSKIVQGASDSQILLELYDQPAFKQRFPAIQARRDAGLTPLNPTEILAYEQQVSQLMHMSGLPASFASSTYAQDLLGHDVSIAELSTRIEQGFMKVSQGPQEVRDKFAQYFGVNGDAALAALFLDPDKSLPELEKWAMSAYVGGIGSRYGVNVGLAKARDIADTGLSEAAVWQGYRQLDTLSPLFSETLGETVDLTKEGVGVDAVFGTAPGAENTLDRRRQTRVNDFGGQPGGGAYATSKGAVGLGVADG